jgi:hypothetical protein
VGGNTGGNIPFSLEITRALASVPEVEETEYEVIVRVEDSTSGAQIKGKQSRHPRDVWYTRVSGIWQTVWLEAVPAVHISKLKLQSKIGFPSGAGRWTKRGPSSRPSPSVTHATLSVHSILDVAKPPRSKDIPLAAAAAAAVSSATARFGASRFGDDGDDESRASSSAQDSLKSSDSVGDALPPWSSSAELIAEAEVFASGAALLKVSSFPPSRNASSSSLLEVQSMQQQIGAAPRVYRVRFDAEKPMGILTRVVGQHLLLVGVKEGSQALSLGVRPGLFLSAVAGFPVGNFKDVVKVLKNLRHQAASKELAQTVLRGEQAAGPAVDRARAAVDGSYVVELTTSVVVGKSSCACRPRPLQARSSPPSVRSVAIPFVVDKSRKEDQPAERRIIELANAQKISWDSTNGSPSIVFQNSTQGSTKDDVDYLHSLPSPDVRSECEASVIISNPHLWSPTDPFLYDVRVRLLQVMPVDPVLKEKKRNLRVVDEVRSYAALREVGRQRSKDGHLRLTLNGEPLFHLGVLDQGWWPEGLLTPPSDQAQLSDLLFIKRAGFNTVRKHMKVENRRYYYHADRVGLMVWQDQPAADENGKGKTDLSPKWTRLKKVHEPKEGRWSIGDHAQFMREFEALIDALEHHQCIVVWVCFNVS